MREIPILFNTSMVQAIFDGRKTQTRRIVKLIEFGLSDTPGYKYHFRDRRLSWNDVNENLYDKYAPCKIGDILWVRETWQEAACFDSHLTGYVYKTDWAAEEFAKGYKIKWHPSIHMPREACRLSLKVTNVRVERLQEIHARDAMKEGFKSKPFEEMVKPEYLKELQNIPVERRESALMMAPKEMWIDEAEIERSPRKWFINLWDNLYKSSGFGWNANPFVWVIEFEKINKEDK